MYRTYVCMYVGMYVCISRSRNKKYSRNQAVGACAQAPSQTHYPVAGVVDLACPAPPSRCHEATSRFGFNIPATSKSTKFKDIYQNTSSSMHQWSSIGDEAYIHTCMHSYLFDCGSDLEN
jgi:hypothetical protein